MGMGQTANQTSTRWNGSEAFRLGADGASEELFSFEDAIRQFAYVEMPFDGDNDGKPDLIRIDIIRPRELDGGVGRVPAIIEPSPYYGLYPRHGERKTYLHDEDKLSSPLVTFPLYYGNYFVPRGYAVILVDTSGTSLSQGFCDIGGKRDIASVGAVVDWLNGRTKGYMSRTERSESTEIRADWATGAAGMLGQSYDGTMATGLAATGIDGLKTIVPISAISSQYDWYHPNGCLLDGDDADGGWYEPYNFAEVLESTVGGLQQRFMTDPDGWKALRDGSDHERRCYNEFWAERNYRAYGDRFKASVFIVHGVNDLNVMMNQVDGLWDALGEAGVPRKMWLHQCAHDDPFDLRQGVWMRTIHRWFDRWLLDVDNGIMDEPAVTLEGPDGVWKDYASWPVPGTAEVRLAVRGSAEDARLGTLEEIRAAASTNGVDGLAAAGENDAADAAEEKGPEDMQVSADASTLSAAAGEQAHVALLKAGRIPELTCLREAGEAASGRLLYVSEPLARNWHVSGAGRVHVRVKTTQGDTNLTAQLLEYGEGSYIQVDPDLRATIQIPETRVASGNKTPQDKAEYKMVVPRRACRDEYVVTRGWISTAHVRSFERFEPLPTGEWVEFDIPLLATDWTVKAGHRIALQLANSTTRLAEVAPADFDVDLDALELTLPVARE